MIFCLSVSAVWVVSTLIGDANTKNVIAIQVGNG